MNDKEYVCANCDGTFVKSTSDEDAMEEAQEAFPGVPMEEMVLICNSCWEAFTAWREEKLQGERT